MVKIGEIGHLGQKFLNGWLEYLKTTVHTKFQLFIPFRYPKNGHYYHAFFTKIDIFNILRFFKFQKFTKHSFFKILT